MFESGNCVRVKEKNSDKNKIQYFNFKTFRRKTFEEKIRMKKVITILLALNFEEKQI